jgi:glycosyltransferase involved in cell wall biosynthesis
MSNTDLQLTISLLISDRLDTVPRCLDSLRLILDAIPSELILIDTSKNSKINALLKTYTDQVYEFEWCNDFAKARNEGLKRAKGEWFMFLDDDE